MRLRPPRAFWVVLDWLAAAFCWVLIFGVLVSGHGNGPHNFTQLLSVPSLLAALLALGLAAPVAFRRRAPGRALVIVLALGSSPWCPAPRSPGARSSRWPSCCTWWPAPPGGPSRGPGWPSP